MSSTRGRVSRAIIERVPTHLDTRSNGRFGTLLTKLSQANGGSAASNVREALRMKLSLILVDDTSVDIAAAESMLRHALNPLLNPQARRRTVKGCLANYELEVVLNVKADARN